MKVVANVRRKTLQVVIGRNNTSNTKMKGEILMNRNLFKRTISLSMALCAMLSMMIIPVFATSDTEGGINFQEAWFPAETMNILQLAYETYSHGSQNAIDLVCATSLVAPFDGKVVYTDKSWGYVVFESVEKVRYANGTIDYMSVCFMHDENIDNMVEACNNGSVIKQGNPIYQQGGMAYGNPDAYGDHVHISVCCGKYSVTNEYGNGDVYAYDAFWINPNLTTNYEGRGEGYAIQSVNNGAPTDYRGRWKNLDYFADCTFYVNKASVVQIKKKTTIKSLPCSKKTCSDSMDVRTGKVGDLMLVVALIKNSVGNYWFHVIIDWNTEAYVFAGDVEMVESFLALKVIIVLTDIIC